METGVWISRAGINAKRTDCPEDTERDPTASGCLELVISTSSACNSDTSPQRIRYRMTEEDSDSNVRTTKPCPTSIHPYTCKCTHAHAKTKEGNHRIVCVGPKRITRASLRK